MGIRVGQPIPLGIQLPEDRNDFRVDAVVLSPAGQILGTVRRIPYRMAGLYQTQEFSMPDEPFVTAVYQVSGPGSDEMMPASEVFTRDDSATEEQARLPAEAVAASLTDVVIHQGDRIVERLTPPPPDKTVTGKVVLRKTDGILEGRVQGGDQAKNRR